MLLIKNGDKLCARAIVTAKARVDQHPNCNGFKRGRRIQAEHAVDLHHKMRVPRGPCGYDELQAFSLASFLYDYQILLCDATRGYVVTSFGPPSQKQLVLLYDDGHYDVITSLPGFFGTSYFCMRCLKPYENQGPHACDNNPDHCSAPLLHVFFDMEAMQDTGCHVPNLVMAETENDEHPVRFQEDSCMRDYFSSSSSRGVSPSSRYSSLWLASNPFPTSPSPLLATRISVTTAWKLTRSPTNHSMGGA